MRLDPTTGGIVSLVHKPSGREMLDAGQGAFPAAHRQAEPEPVAAPQSAGQLRHCQVEGADRLAGKGPAAGRSAGPARLAAT